MNWFSLTHTHKHTYTPRMCRHQWETNWKLAVEGMKKKIVRLFFECVFADYWMCMRIWVYVSNGKTMNLHKPTFNHYYCLLHTRFSVYIVHLGDQKHTYCTNISNVAHIKIIFIYLSTPLRMLFSFIHLLFNVFFGEHVLYICMCDSLGFLFLFDSWTDTLNGAFKCTRLSILLSFCIFLTRKWSRRLVLVFPHTHTFIRIRIRIRYALPHWKCNNI